MTVTSSECVGPLETTVFYLLLISGLLVISSTFMVFTNEEEAEGKGWKYLALLWLWPIRPFYTSSGLNDKGKQWRPVYIGSITSCAIIMVVLLASGFCGQ